MFGRNIGFVNVAEQERLRTTPVFICGVGGMGGACLYSLVRSGFENLGVADIDIFEISNLNRQMFANLSTIGADKAESSVQQITQLNPAAKVKNWGHDWLDKLDQILSEYKIIVNGTDDLKASLQLYRKAREHGCTVIDAYTSPLPSIYVTRPTDKMPEERLGFPSVGRDIQRLTAADIDRCKLAEVVFVMTNSSSIKHIDFSIAMEMVQGKRSRMSLAPMVIMTGNLMAYQVFYLALGKPTAIGPDGVFFNPQLGLCEKPGFILIRKIKELAVRLYLRKVMP
jgi:hypothetical protein